VKPYFDSDRPRVFAHRGLALDAPENTPLAFAQAIAAGADYIETDVWASSDGRAVIAHDEDLRRLTGDPRRVGDLSVEELAKIDLGHGQSIPTLVEVLHGFPETRFNIDIKDAAAVEPTVQAIRDARAIDRVLVTSFSESRRRAAVAQLPGVATSASALPFVRALLANRLHLTPALTRALRDIDAVQIPQRALGLSTVGPRTIARFHRAGIEVHIWTINDPARMRALFAAGVDGVVTDRADLGVFEARASKLSDNPL